MSSLEFIKSILICIKSFDQAIGNRFGVNTFCVEWFSFLQTSDSPFVLVKQKNLYNFCISSIYFILLFNLIKIDQFQKFYKIYHLSPELMCMSSTRYILINSTRFSRKLHD